jgi:hypothetical protein
MAHGDDASHAENEREGKEVPLLPEKIDAGISKKFHAGYDPFKKSAVRRSPFVLRSSSFLVQPILANSESRTTHSVF